MAKSLSGVTLGTYRKYLNQQKQIQEATQAPDGQRLADALAMNRDNRSAVKDRVEFQQQAIQEKYAPIIDQLQQQHDQYTEQQEMLRSAVSAGTPYSDSLSRGLSAVGDILASTHEAKKLGEITQEKGKIEEDLQEVLQTKSEEAQAAYNAGLDDITLQGLERQKNVNAAIGSMGITGAMEEDALDISVSDRLSEEMGEVEGMQKDYFRRALSDIRNAEDIGQVSELLGIAGEAAEEGLLSADGLESVHSLAALKKKELKAIGEEKSFIKDFGGVMNKFMNVKEKQGELTSVKNVYALAGRASRSLDGIAGSFGEIPITFYEEAHALSMPGVFQRLFHRVAGELAHGEGFNTTVDQAELDRLYAIPGGREFITFQKSLAALVAQYRHSLFGGQLTKTEAVLFNQLDFSSPYHMKRSVGLLLRAYQKMTRDRVLNTTRSILADGKVPAKYRSVGESILEDRVGTIGKSVGDTSLSPLFTANLDNLTNADDLSDRNFAAGIYTPDLMNIADKISDPNAGGLSGDERTYFTKKDIDLLDRYYRDEGSDTPQYVAVQLLKLYNEYQQVNPNDTEASARIEKEFEEAEEKYLAMRGGR